MSRLADVDLSVHLDKKEAKAQLAEAQERLVRLRLRLGGQLGGGLGPPLCVLFEGWDASGKGGAIKRLVEELDPRHARVAQFAAPTHDEKRHHFLWRFYKAIPGLGGMCVFDRSWYGRVLVERIESYASKGQWTRAYDEIVQFERTLVLEGMILVKFWLQISPKEQLKRFKKREKDPLKSWKLTDEDWRNRDKRDAYDAAVEDMVARTSIEPHAIWHLIPADSKRYARVAVIRTVIEEIEAGMRRHGMEPPDPIEED